jgi:hypothetical protein
MRAVRALPEPDRRSGNGQEERAGNTIIPNVLREIGREEGPNGSTDGETHANIVEVAQCWAEGRPAHQ